MLSNGTGGRFEEYVIVRGSPRKSAMMSSVFLEKFMVSGHVECSQSAARSHQKCVLSRLLVF